MCRTTVLPPSADRSPGFETQPSCKAAVLLNNGAADAQCVCEGGEGSAAQIDGPSANIFS